MNKKPTSRSPNTAWLTGWNDGLDALEAEQAQSQNDRIISDANATRKDFYQRIGDAINGEQAQEPVAWTLTETLVKRVTTTSGHLWFSNPVNCCWTPLYTHPAPPADDFDTWQKNPYTLVLQKSIAEDYVPKQAQQAAVPMPMTGIEVLRAARMVQSVFEHVPHRDVIEFVRAIEAHHGITQGDGNARKVD